MKDFVPVYHTLLDEVQDAAQKQYDEMLAMPDARPEDVEYERIRPMYDELMREINTVYKLVSPEAMEAARRDRENTEKKEGADHDGA